MARPRKKKFGDSEALHFGDCLVQLRKKRGISQIELAEKAGLYQATVSQYERGERWPDAKQVVKLASALRVSTDEILGIKSIQKNGQPMESRSVLRRLRHIVQMPRRDRQALLRVIDGLIAKGNGRRAI